MTPSELYTGYLSDEYDVRTAYGGTEAVEILSSDLDVVLLDRRLPIVSGNEVLAEIEEGDHQCRVAMVTAVDPDFDIIDMGCDDYIVKPVTRGAVGEAVDRLMRVTEYDERMREPTANRLERNALQIEKSTTELENSEGIQRLQDGVAALEAEIDDVAEEIGTDDVTREL